MRPKYVLQVCGSSAPSRLVAHPIQTCPRPKWIALACRVALRFRRFLGPTHTGARHSGRSGFRVLLSRPFHMFVHVFSRDRKSTRLNSSHTVISYAVFCLKKKK